MLGKKIRNNIYVHRYYKNRILPLELLEVINKAPRQDYDYLKYDQEKNTVTLAWCDDWDSKHEPVILHQERYAADGTLLNVKHPNPDKRQVIHGKHLFVDWDYHGFDWEAARARYNSYQGQVDKSRIGYEAEWLRTLENLGMEV
jgi:hypothetical protein